jgi:hypothetical protein
MNLQHSDAFVFFGATGDLAYKKIFPSLQAMVKRGHLNVPVIGVARSAKNSMDSAIGLSTMLAIGPEHFRSPLAGFHEMDEQRHSGRSTHAGNPGQAGSTV